MQCQAFKAGRLTLEFDRREVFVGGEQIRLTATEYHLLDVLVRKAQGLKITVVSNESLELMRIGFARFDLAKFVPRALIFGLTSNTAPTAVF